MSVYDTVSTRDSRFYLGRVMAQGAKKPFVLGMKFMTGVDGDQWGEMVYLSKDEFKSYVAKAVALLENEP